MSTYPTGSCLLFADGIVVLFVPGQNGRPHRTHTVCEKYGESVWTVNPEYGEHQKIFCLEKGMDVARYEGKRNVEVRNHWYLPVDGELCVIDNEGAAILLKEWDVPGCFKPNRRIVFI